VELLRRRQRIPKERSSLDSSRSLGVDIVASSTTSVTTITNARVVLSGPPKHTSPDGNDVSSACLDSCSFVDIEGVLDIGADSSDRRAVLRSHLHSERSSEATLVNRGISPGLIENTISASLYVAPDRSLRAV
jgi:hypothetical protein